MPSLGWLKFGGEASYAIYLFQLVGFYAASRMAHDWPLLFRAITYCICAVASGVVFYAWVERPLQRMVTRPKHPMPAPIKA